MQEPSDPSFVIGNGSGFAGVAGRDFDLLRSQLHVKPRKLFDHMKLLASVNRRAAAVVKTVSPHCHVAYVNADDRTSPTSHVFVEKGESAPFAMPVLLFGVDLHDMARRFLEHNKARQRGENPDLPDDSAMNEDLKRRL